MFLIIQHLETSMYQKMYHYVPLRYLRQSNVTMFEPQMLF